MPLLLLFCKRKGPKASKDQAAKSTARSAVLGARSFEASPRIGSELHLALWCGIKLLATSKSTEEDQVGPKQHELVCTYLNNALQEQSLAASSSSLLLCRGIRHF